MPEEPTEGTDTAESSRTGFATHHVNLPLAAISLLAASYWYLRTHGDLAQAPSLDHLSPPRRRSAQERLANVIAISDAGPQRSELITVLQSPRLQDAIRSGAIERRDTVSSILLHLRRHLATSRSGSARVGSELLAWPVRAPGLRLTYPILHPVDLADHTPQTVDSDAHALLTT